MGNALQRCVGASEPSRVKVRQEWALTAANKSTPTTETVIATDGQEATEKGDLPLYELFGWLGWTPDVSLPVGAKLRRVFPGALPSAAMHRRTAVVLESMGFNPDNTIFGHSTCPDEINNQVDDLTSIMGRYWGASFPLGGIGGAPFVGKTGFGAFSHHVPENGNVLIVYGPHIAISSTGELGKYLREGQTSHSCACGAVLAAYQQCCVCNEESADVKGSKASAEAEDDMEQAWLRGAIRPQVRHIQAAEEPMGELVLAAFDAIRDKMRRIVNTGFGSGKLVLIGGIQINMPEPGEDHFLPLSFTIEDARTPPEDVLHRIAIA